MFFKIFKNNIITIIGESNIIPSTAEEITEEKYNALMATIQNRPNDTLDIVHYLSAETETYESRERTHEETVEWYASAILTGRMTIDEVPEEYQEETQAKLSETEQTYTLDEAAALLASEVNE